DELDVVLGTYFGKLRVLGKESITGMDGIGIVDLRRSDVVGNLQIGIVACRWPDADRLVRKAHMQALRIRSGVVRNGLDPHFLTGTHDAKGTFSSILNQYFFKHATQSYVFNSPFQRTWSGQNKALDQEL